MRHSWETAGWFCRVVYALDLFINALTGGKCRETLSSRFGRAFEAGSRAPCPAWFYRHCMANLEAPQAPVFKYPGAIPDRSAFLR